MDSFMQLASEEARQGADENNFPVGSVIVKDGEVIGVGHNRHRETGDPTSHAEIEAIRDAARRAPGVDPSDLFGGAVCYTTMMPCQMCAGAIIRFGFTKVVVAEVETYVDSGAQPLMERQGLAVEVGREQDCIDLVETYYQSDPAFEQIMRSARRGRLEL